MTSTKDRQTVYVLAPNANAKTRAPREMLSEGRFEMHGWEPDKSEAEQLTLTEAITPGATWPVTKQVVEVAPRLKLVAQFGVGLGDVDIPAATPRGVYVANVPAASVMSRAEHAPTLMLALAKNLQAAMQWTESGMTPASRYHHA